MKNTVPSELIDQIKADFDSEIYSSGFDGVAYAEVEGQTVYESEASRYNSSTIFRVASVSKQFVAAAVLMLCDEGKMSVSDTIDKYFPEFYTTQRYYTDGTPLSDEVMSNLRANKVTVHHLLSMRSGIPDYLILAQQGFISPEALSDLGLDMSADYSSEKNRAALKKWIFSSELSLPDRVYSYSNSNYLLLGEIIEQVSGMPYEDFITERIFKPLGMSDTSFGEKTDVSTLDFAYPDSDEPEYMWLSYDGVRYGCGDMLSNAKDLAKWGREFLDGADRRVLTESMIERMTENYAYAGYGYGLTFNDNINMIYHEGNLPPYSSILAVIPSEKFVYISIDNRSATPLSQLSQKLCTDYCSIAQ